MVTESGQSVPYSEGYNEASFQTVDAVKMYEIPLLYYKGYEAWVQDEEGNSHTLEVVTDDNHRGEMFVLNPENYAGILTVKYKGTAAQKVSLLVSVVTLLGLIGYGIMYKKSQRR